MPQTAAYFRNQAQRFRHFRANAIATICDDRECGDFAPGRFAWKRDEFRLFDQPILYRGKQGIFNVPADLIPASAACGANRVNMVAF